MTMRNWPNSERPRERLLQQGASSLSDAELIAICLRTGTKGKSAIELGRELIHHFGGLRNLLNASFKDVRHIKGLGEAKYVQLHAALEISQRYLHETLKREDILTSTRATKQFLSARLRDLPYEVFAALFLDNKNRLICFEELFRGGINGVNIHPGVIIKHALKHNAAGVIFVHNHPSGIAEPSVEDKIMTKKLCSALALIEINVLDHLIVGDGKISSFIELGLL